jgi:hypothetical protein
MVPSSTPRSAASRSSRSVCMAMIRRNEVCLRAWHAACVCACNMCVHACNTQADARVLCVGVKIGGAELRAFGHVISMSINCCHVCCMAMDLDAKICGVETCYLGVMVHGAELRIYFLKSFEKECICEILFLKGSKKIKKTDGRHGCCIHRVVTSHAARVHGPGR